MVCARANNGSWSAHSGPIGANQMSELFLDMTFGSGGHTHLLLNHKMDLVDQVVCCDCDRTAYNEAKALKVIST